MKFLFIQFMLYCFQIPSFYVKDFVLFFSYYCICIISEIHRKLRLSINAIFTKPGS